MYAPARFRAALAEFPGSVPMLRRLAIMAIVVTAAMTSATAQADYWLSYVNGRFGAAADWPFGWTPGEPPPNEDGRKFFAPNGEAILVVSGIYTLGEFDPMYSPRGSQVTYRASGPDWYVVSGLLGDRVFYMKRMLGCRGQIEIGMYMEYPASRKLAYDPIVLHVSSSLHFDPAPGWACQTTGP
jgi:hypothetical protein